MLLSLTTHVTVFSDCSSAIARDTGPFLPQPSSRLSAAWLSPTLTWTSSHPEKTISQSKWTDNDWRIHLADEIVDSSEDLLGTVRDTQLFLCDCTHFLGNLVARYRPTLSSFPPEKRIGNDTARNGIWKESTLMHHLDARHWWQHLRSTNATPQDRESGGPNTSLR